MGSGLFRILLSVCSLLYTLRESCQLKKRAEFLTAASGGQKLKILFIFEEKFIMG